MLNSIDVHCHILPGVDDGSESMDETMSMIKMAYSEGIRGMIATPHYHYGYAAQDWEKVYHVWEQVREKVSAELPEMEIYLGREIYSDSRSMDMLAADAGSGRNTMGSSRYVLIEFTPGAEYREIKNSLSNILSLGYQTILAHAERCMSIRKKPELAEELVQMGNYIQLNAGSIAGSFSDRRFCKKLMSMDCVHFVGTDCHGSTKRTPQIKKSIEYVIKHFGEEYAQQLYWENPEKMLGNEYL